MKNTTNEAAFADTRLEVIMNNGARCSRVFLADSAAIAWDGAKPETNGAIWSDRCGAYCYVELRLTGREPRKHVGGIFGTKAKIRFTGSDDSGEWMDVVVRPVPASFGSGR